MDRDRATVACVALLSPAIPPYRGAELLGYALANVNPRLVFVTLEREAVDVDHGELGVRVRGEQGFLPGVQATVARQELDGGCGQVHDEMGDGRRDGDGGGPRPFGVGIAARELLLRWYHGRLAGLGCGKDGVGGLADEDAAICVEGPDVRGDLSLEY